MEMSDMKKKINVIDLDSTLLPHNSLIYYVLLFLKNQQCFLPVLFHLEQRITGKITKEEFLKKIMTDESTINVLCTASPEDYVKYLCKKLGWPYISSTLNNNDENFIHMFGHNKIIAVQKMYPKQNYIYHLALSDNMSDQELLKLFDKSYHIKNGKRVYLSSTK